MSRPMKSALRKGKQSRAINILCNGERKSELVTGRLVFYVPAVHKSFENTMEKGEIALYEICLLFQQCFLPFEELYAIFITFKNCLLQT